jgi:hypothetical protein
MVDKINNLLRSRTTRGVVGFFDDDHKCVQAAHKMRQAGYTQFDAITPFPVHGMEEAVGIKRSPIPYVTFVFALLGAGLGLFYQYWTSAENWPINVGGMPFFSLPAFIPITFETTILLGALSSVAAMFALNKLPMVDPPVLDPDLTSHKFALWVPETEKNFDALKVEQFLRELGAQDVRQSEF